MRPDERAGCWPEPSLIELLRAGLWSGSEAAAAFDRWYRQIDLDDVDYAVQRLLPLAHANLLECGIERPVMSRIEGVRRYWWVRNASQLRAMAERLGELRARGFGPFMLLKGAAVGPRYYPELGARPMNDVDVLVPERSAPELLSHLATEGFRPTNAALGEDPRHWWDAVGESTHGLNLRGPDGRPLDLHWRAFCARHATPVPGDPRLWSRAEETELFGAEVLVPRAEHLLVQICAHGLRRPEEPALWWIPDAVHIIRGTDLDWSELCRDAHDRGLALVMSKALRFLHDQLGLQLGEPLRVLERMPIPALERARFWVRTRARDEDLAFRALRILDDYRWQSSLERKRMGPTGLWRFCQQRWSVSAGELPIELARRFTALARIGFRTERPGSA